MSYNSSPGSKVIDQRVSRPGRTKVDSVRDAILEDLIMSGEVASGSYLPTEFDLVGTYGASRITIRSALANLQEAGYIVRQQGKGSLVLPVPQTMFWGLTQLRSVESFAATQGLSVKTEKLRMYEAELDRTTARRLERAPGSIGVFVERAKSFDNVLVGWIVDIIPVDVVDFATMGSEFDGSVLDVLIGQKEFATAYSDCEVSAESVDSYIAEKLEVDVGQPSFFIDELTRSADGLVLDWSRAWTLNKHFRFTLRRHRSPQT